MASSNTGKDATNSEGDWFCVPDESRSAQAIKELKAQLEVSQKIANDFKSAVSNLLRDFDSLSQEVERLKIKEIEADSLKHTVKLLEMTCNELKKDVTSAKATAKSESQLQSVTQDQAKICE